VPTYAYACTACDHRFDAQQSFTDNALTDCPECQGRLRKLFNAVGIVFKGSGFYRTDSRSHGSGGSKAAPGTGSESATASSDASSTSDASSAASSSGSSSGGTAASGSGSSGGSGAASSPSSSSRSSTASSSAA